jgi:hypothetical protein
MGEEDLEARCLPDGKPSGGQDLPAHRARRFRCQTAVKQGASGIKNTEKFTGSASRGRAPPKVEVGHLPRTERGTFVVQ